MFKCVFWKFKFSSTQEKQTFSQVKWWAHSDARCVLQVLNMHGKVLTVRHQAVNRRKDNRSALALDSEQNNIHVKDIVKVIDGPHSVSSSPLFRQ